MPTRNLDLKIQPRLKVLIQRLQIGSCQFPDNFYHESFLNGRKLCLDARGHVQSRRAPFREGKIRVSQNRGNGNHKQIRAAAANDDGGPNFAAELAVKIDEAVQQRLRVDWRANPDVQNEMRNAIDDLLYEARSAKGVPLTMQDMDAIIERALDIARSRYPR